MRGGRPAQEHPAVRARGGGRREGAGEADEGAVGRPPRYGYRRVWALLRAEKFAVNRKRVHRLWRREGLKVPRKQRKRRRPGHSQNSCTRRRAEHPGHVWSYDFVMDQTATAGG